MNLKFQEKDLKTVAVSLLSEYSRSKVWIFNAQLGTGKTTLIKSICKQLGVKDNMTSPTFSIINEYLTDSRDRIYHFDFFRLKNTAEAIDIGVEDYFFSGDYCFIEWPKLVLELLPTPYVEIHIDLDGNQRLLDAQLQ